jgi:hypothetical protein
MEQIERKHYIYQRSKNYAQMERDKQNNIEKFYKDELFIVEE